MTPSMMRSMSLLRALVTLGTAGVRQACDQWEQAETEIATPQAPSAAPARSAVTAKRLASAGRMRELLAFVRRGPATFSMIRAAFPQCTPNQLSQSLNYAKSRGLVAKRGRSRGAPWRARAA